MEPSTTIIQLCTPKGVGAIHILRVSGERSLEFLCQHTSLRRLQQVRPRHVYMTTFEDQGRAIDQVLSFYMKAPRSYTGEDMVEIHCHGSLAVVEHILKMAVRDGLRLAEPGEFTHRSCLYGKMTLEQAEAMNVFIRSESSHRRRVSLDILAGKASLRFDVMQQQILSILARLEFAIEFPEEDIPVSDESKADAYADYTGQVRRILAYFQAIKENYDKGSKLEEGIQVLLLGRPNVGKSTLMNALIRHDRVLVSAEPGTTRDLIKERVYLGDVPVKLIDSAGLRVTKSPVESAGMHLALEALRQVEGVIYLISSIACVRELKRLLAGKWGATLRKKQMFYYISKGDTIDSAKRNVLQEAMRAEHLDVEEVISLSSEASKATSLKKVEERLASWLRTFHWEASDVEGGTLSLMNERHVYCAGQIIRALQRVLKKIRLMESEEVLVEELLSVKAVFEELNLSVDHEKMYDKLFGSFCLGK